MANNPVVNIGLQQLAELESSQARLRELEKKLTAMITFENDGVYIADDGNVVCSWSDGATGMSLEAFMRVAVKNNFQVGKQEYCDGVD